MLRQIKSWFLILVMFGLGGLAPGARACEIHVDGVSSDSDVFYNGYYIDANGCLLDPARYRLDEVEALLPAGPFAGNLAAILVNGANNTVSAHYQQMLLAAEFYDHPIVGVHNAAPGSLPRELAEMFRIRNPVFGTLNAALRQRVVEAGETIRLVGLSQGAHYISRAIKRFKLTVTRDREYLARIEVETFGGAASVYPRGPNYVHYANYNDQVTTVVGVLSPLRRLSEATAVVTFEAVAEDCTFASGGDNAAAKVHSLCAYISWWQPFDEVRMFLTGGRATFLWSAVPGGNLGVID